MSVLVRSLILNAARHRPIFMGATKKIALFISVLAWLWSPILADQPAARQKVYQGSIQLYPNNLVFTKIKINGRQASALIDTGSSKTLEITSRLARELDLQLSEDKNRRFRGHDGRPSYALAGLVNSVTIADYEKRNVKVEVIDGNIENIARQVETDFEAILGWGFLSRNYLALNYARQTLLLSDGPINLGKYKMSMKYEVVKHVPVIQGAFNGGEVGLLFDTGAPFCSIDSDYAKAPAGQKLSKSLRVAGNNLTTEWRVKDLSVIKNSLGCVGVVGNNLLQSYTVYFDPNERLINLH